MVLKDFIRLFLSYFVAFLGFMLGGFDGLLLTLVWFSIFDYFTGVLKAFYNGNPNAKMCFKGIIKKVALYIVVSIAQFLNTYLGIPAIREMVIMFFIGHEGISILENVSEIGIDIPTGIKDSLRKMIDNSENNDKDNKNE